jgi:general secretion pathway protein L
MTAGAKLLAFLSRWIDDAATGLARIGAELRRGRRIEFMEQVDGSFLAAQWRKGAAKPLDEPPLWFDQDRLAGATPRLRTLLAGSRLSVVLAPSRFVFRLLELPRGAGPFLEGVVRAQIDRLTPWSASGAAFGWSAPRDAGSDRIALTVAATARALIAPISQALIASRVASIEMSTRAGDDGGLEIPILAQQAGDPNGLRRVRFGLIAGLAVCALVFMVSLGAWIALSAGYDARFATLQGQIAQRRAALSREGGSAGEQALRALQARKRATPSAVMILEALSKALPDDSHLTELRIEDGKVQLAGLADDASELVGLIEQSPQFARATFFAPTVRGQNGGETFHIEARLEPSFGGLH